MTYREWVTLQVIAHVGPFVGGAGLGQIAHVRHVSLTAFLLALTIWLAGWWRALAGLDETLRGITVHARGCECPGPAARAAADGDDR